MIFPLIFAALSLVSAAVSPLTPPTGTAGKPCNIVWTTDPTATWTNVTISLMSGSNLAMNVVTDIATGIDGTSLAAYTWTCPSVMPYSDIYFYQFTNNGLNPTWTTRFTLADAAGKSTPPQFATQPSGQAIPWGTGALLGVAASSASGGTPVITSAGTVASTLLATTSSAAVVASRISSAIPVSVITPIAAPIVASSSSMSVVIVTATTKPSTTSSTPSATPSVVKASSATRTQTIGAGIIFLGTLLIV